MSLIDYSRIPYKEKRSTGERVEENAFYMPKYEEDPSWYAGYDAVDFFGLEFIHGYYKEIEEENT